MKKVIYLLVLCMVLGMAGCGTNQENKEPVSGIVSVETENKENDDVVQNEQIADTGSYPPCVMVDGVIYKDTGYVASMPGCGTMDGEIVSTVAGTELPSENNQSNFGSGYHYQRSSEGQLIVVIDDERIIFRDIEKDDTSNPKKNNKINTKKKEIIEEEHINLEQKLEQEEQKNNNLNKLNILFNKYLVELEKNNLKNKINNENKEKIKNKIEEKDNLTKNNLKNTEQNNLNKKINYYKYLFIFILLIIFNIFNFIFVKNKILNYCILSLIPIEIIIFTINNIKNRKINNQIKIKNLKNKKIQDELKEKITIIDSQINLLEENIKKLQKEIDEESLVSPLKPIIRIATEEDTKIYKENKEKAKETFELCLEKIKEHNLQCI